MHAHQKYINRYSKNINCNGEISKYFLEEKYATGTILRCELAKGMEMLFFDYFVRKDQIMKGFENGNLVEIFYCLQGSIELKYGESSILLKDNQISIYDFKSCPEEVKLKKGNIKGISLLLDIGEAETVINQFLPTKTWILQHMQEEIKKGEEMLLAFGNSNLKAVFLGIAECPFDYNREYLLLKALELIWVSCTQLEQKKNNLVELQKNGSRYRMFQKALSYMEYHINQPFSVKELSEKTGMTQKDCNQLFIDYTNLTAFAYFKEMRLKLAKDLLVQTEKSITEIAGEVGWSNASKFSDAFKKKYSMAPREYRHENKLI